MYVVVEKFQSLSRHQHVDSLIMVLYVPVTPLTIQFSTRMKTDLSTKTFHHDFSCLYDSIFIQGEDQLEQQDSFETQHA